VSEISERIRAARERKGWSNYELAKRSGVSSGYFTQLENDGDEGQRIQEPTLATLKKIAAALEVPVEELAFGVEAKSEPAA
jgi:transcriptional regulator with XRE-family HTH domain